MLTQHTKKVTNPNFLLSLSFSFFSQLVQWFAWLVGFWYFSFCLCKILCIFLLVYAKTSTLLTLFLLYIPLQAGDHPPQKTKHFRLFLLAQYIPFFHSQSYHLIICLNLWLLPNSWFLFPLICCGSHCGSRNSVCSLLLPRSLDVIVFFFL